MEKRGSVSGFPTLGSRCTDMQISYRWVYGFLIVGFQGIGWARLFYDLNFILPLGAGAIWGLKSNSNFVTIQPDALDQFAWSNALRQYPGFVPYCPITISASILHYRALAKYSTAGWHLKLFAMSATQPRGSAEWPRSLSASAVCYPNINTQHSKKVVRRKGKSRG